MPNFTGRIDVMAWLPDQTSPVLAGQITLETASTRLLYDTGYLSRSNAVSVYGRDMGIHSGSLDDKRSDILPAPIQDTLPESWGRRVLAASLYSPDGELVPAEELSDASLLLSPGSDRIGALSYHISGQTPHAHDAEAIELDQLMAGADHVERGEMIPPDMRHMIAPLSSVGGSRPKALYTDASGRKYIAKFGSLGDSYPILRGEYIAMRLADLAGIDVTSVKLVKVGSRPVLLVERFDRVEVQQNEWARKSIVSARNWRRKNVARAGQISYVELADNIRANFDDATAAQEELFKRLVFNILVGNTDDHAGNHAAFWDGRTLKLTPAYDITPQRRTFSEANQALPFTGGSRSAKLTNAASIAPAFGITSARFGQIMHELVGTIVDHWNDICDEANLSRNERHRFDGNQFLNAYAFSGYGRPPILT
ncbi:MULTISPECIES: type II toxin-antitoxin system HipA family toxin [Pacificibacter]|uniref:type II toxin-antitoxin system HipA family toxin n=1 Tax=Pacificibacter TaxID=1042323 RepID=UPI001C092DD8|nr:MULTISPECIES: type II toxin-antitoxin system HipA family toxin [Pacificibacter]MBU2936508.1 type II toxin-antitoxin system HipA family toxin [Pacificibacter marinus]MDO6614690.1 type II toxin-antitoxin system HipA family toxin [Pacificibacter sp. 1_MG-2023]